MTARTFPCNVPRVSTMRRMLCCRVQRIALVVIGALSFSSLLVILWNVDSIPLPPDDVETGEQEIVRLPRTVETAAENATAAYNHNTTSPPSSPTPWPTCERNTSMADNVTDFASLPAHIQDHLYYRHCRHFPLLLDVPDKCGGPERSGDVFLLLVIKSTPENYVRREVLRKTWGEERIERGKQIRRLFLVGTTHSGFERQRLDQMLELEQREHGDILQWEFNDSFYNLTLKQVLFLEWMVKKCPHVQFLLNGDDDIFANTDNMVEYLLGIGDKKERKDEHLFIGNLMSGVGPLRWPTSKYYVPVQVQEANGYPDYCGGGGFLLSGYTASVIYEMSKSINVHPIDDVYMGFCLQRAGLKPEDHMGVKTFGLKIPSKILDPFHPCFYREMLLVHGFMPPHIYVMWHQIRDPKLKCESV